MLNRFSWLVIKVRESSEALWVNMLTELKQRVRKLKPSAYNNTKTLDILEKKNSVKLFDFIAVNTL